MGCFRACFGHSKRPKQLPKSLVEIPPSNHGFKASNGVCALERAEGVVEAPSIEELNKDSLEKLEDQIDLCHTTENTYGPIIENNLDVIKNEKSGMEEDESRGSSNLSNAFSLPLNHRYADLLNSDDEHGEEMDYLDVEEKEERKDDDDVDGKSKLLIENESTESLFSLSFGSRKHVCTVQAGENEVHSPDLSHQPDNASSDKESRCPNENVDSVHNPIENVALCLSAENASSDKESRCPNENVDSVRNPIENVALCLSAEKVKAALPPVHYLEKENISLDKGCNVLTSPEPTYRPMQKLKEKRSDSKYVKGEIAVETSLSNWLAESETTPKSKSSTSSIGNSPMWTRNSAKSYEDRPILGALTLEELRQFSLSSTPRRLRSRSPEETPIIGTVGSYWSHSGQDADSNPGSTCRGLTKTVRKNSQDEKLNWNSTPFLERLDMTLTSNSAEV